MLKKLGGTIKNLVIQATRICVPLH